ncbi:uncharacterized protein PAC_00906 [Phialocephala subalpina]|uniref:C2H2-type domain-containing protein n=1 Tax=Phialocephala subalpina TaxID=576137 RepID=A0A1L7WE32_9HELO|nr:uncharacterized protein PAC_00906 [Phialocephala subalpina]
MISKFLTKKKGKGGDDGQQYPLVPTSPHLTSTPGALDNGESLGSYSNTFLLLDNSYIQYGGTFVDPMEVQHRPPSPPSLGTLTPGSFTKFLEEDIYHNDPMFGVNFHFDENGAVGNAVNSSDGTPSGQQGHASPQGTSSQLSQYKHDQTRVIGIDSSPTILHSQEGYDSTVEAGSQLEHYEHRQTGVVDAVNPTVGVPWAATSHFGQPSNVANRTDPTLTAQQQFNSAFPNGSIIMDTPVAAFECGLHALRLSFLCQFPTLRAPSINELRVIATSDVIAQRFLEAEGRPVDVNNFNAGHVAAILEEYSLRQGYVLQLGIYWTNREPFIQYAANPSAITLWIYNNNAQSATTLGHYSGLKPNNGEGDQTDRLHQYDQTDRMSPEPTADTPTPITTTMPTPQQHNVGAKVVNTQVSDTNDWLWPTICFSCKRGDHGQYTGEQYYNWSEFFLHWWMVHSTLEVWTPRLCFWEGCNDGGTHFTSEECLTHVFSTHKMWTPQPCPWEDCYHVVKAYSTWNKCLTHVFGVHKKIHHCDYDGPCEFKPGGRAFGNLQDKQRHVTDKHAPGVHYSGMEATVAMLRDAVVVTSKTNPMDSILRMISISTRRKTYTSPAAAEGTSATLGDPDLSCVQLFGINLYGLQLYLLKFTLGSSLSMFHINLDSAYYAQVSSLANNTT